MGLGLGLGLGLGSPPVQIDRGVGWHPPPRRRRRPQSVSPDGSTWGPGGVRVGVEVVARVGVGSGLVGVRARVGVGVGVEPAWLSAGRPARKAVTVVERSS